MNSNNQILNAIKLAVLSVDPTAEIVLFGSRARGDFKLESDWDVLVLTDNDQNDWNFKRRIREVLFQLELETGQIISSIVRNKRFWNKISMTLLHEEIEREGVQL